MGNWDTPIAHCKHKGTLITSYNLNGDEFLFIRFYPFCSCHEIGIYI